jgi:hypothetical protein
LGAPWDQKNPENKKDLSKQDKLAGLNYQSTAGQSFKECADLLEELEPEILQFLNEIT